MSFYCTRREIPFRVGDCKVTNSFSIFSQFAHQFSIILHSQRHNEQSALNQKDEEGL